LIALVGLAGAGGAGWWLLNRQQPQTEAQAGSPPNPAGSGTVATPPKSPDEALPQPATVDEGYAQPAVAIEDVTVTPLRLDAAELMPCLAWSADGKAFFALEKSGKLSRIDAASFKEQRRLFLGRRCSWLTWCASFGGLVEGPAESYPSG
jgi:hypothetical protein